MAQFALCPRSRCGYQIQLEANDSNKTTDAPLRCPKCGVHVRQLSVRETQVVQFLANGKSNKEIASALCISVKTVEAYRMRSMIKIGAHSLSELTLFAVRNSLVEM